MEKVKVQNIEKTCKKCNRSVKETIHTSIGHTIDYFEKETDGKGKGSILCIDCDRKKKA